MSQSQKVIIPSLPIGNQGAVANMVRKCGGEAVITADPEDLARAHRIILAGVGAFDAGVRALEEGNWLKPLHEIAQRGEVPILGICLGMQLMCRQSDEGHLPGMGWFEADVKRIVSPSHSLKVPHMGWNTITLAKPNELISCSPEEQRFYFVHSYHVACDDPRDVMATTTHGIEITAAISRNRLFGTQFHPEKSHRYGMGVISSFIHLPRGSY
jgi:glutamine amidotransferase